MIAIRVRTPWITEARLKICQPRLTRVEYRYAEALFYAQEITSWDDRSSTINMQIGKAFNGVAMIMLGRDDMSDVAVHNSTPEDDATVCCIIDKLVTLLPVQRM